MGRERGSPDVEGHPFEEESLIFGKNKENGLPRAVGFTGGKKSFCAKMGNHGKRLSDWRSVKIDSLPLRINMRKTAARRNLKIQNSPAFVSKTARGGAAPFSFIVRKGH